MLISVKESIASTPSELLQRNVKSTSYIPKQSSGWGKMYEEAIVGIDPACHLVPSGSQQPVRLMQRWADFPWRG